MAVNTAPQQQSKFNDDMLHVCVSQLKLSAISFSDFSDSVLASLIEANVLSNDYICTHKLCKYINLYKQSKL